MCSLRYCLKWYFSKGVYSFTLSTVNANLWRCDHCIMSSASRNHSERFKFDIRFIGYLGDGKWISNGSFCWQDNLSSLSHQTLRSIFSRVWGWPITIPLYSMQYNVHCDCVVYWNKWIKSRKWVWMYKSGQYKFFFLQLNSSISHILYNNEYEVISYNKTKQQQNNPAHMHFINYSCTMWQ